MIAVSAALAKTTIEFPLVERSNRLLKRSTKSTKSTGSLSAPSCKFVDRSCLGRKERGASAPTAVLPLDRVDLVDAFAVTIFGEFGAQPGAHNVAHLGRGDRFAAQGEDIRAVV